MCSDWKHLPEISCHKCQKWYSQILKFVVHKWYHCQANLLWSLNSRPPPSKRTSYRPSDRLQTSWNWKLSQMLVASDGVVFVRTGLPTFCPCPNPSKPPSMSWIKIMCNELTNNIPRPFGPCVYQRLFNFRNWYQEPNIICNKRGKQ